MEKQYIRLSCEEHALLQIELSHGASSAPSRAESDEVRLRCRVK